MNCKLLLKDMKFDLTKTLTIKKKMQIKQIIEQYIFVKQLQEFRTMSKKLVNDEIKSLHLMLKKFQDFYLDIATKEKKKAK